VAPRPKSAFTLIEIMIVVSIIALLAVIAVPSFLRARQRSQNSKFINALRVAADAVDTYAMEHGGQYPADRNRGVVPPELASYLDATLDWTARRRLAASGIGTLTSSASRRRSRWSLQRSISRS
jgi:prepilin-type N-terminal cleavage/methylation domain-containing protein